LLDDEVRRIKYGAKFFLAHTACPVPQLQLATTSLITFLFQ